MDHPNSCHLTSTHLTSHNCSRVTSSVKQCTVVVTSIFFNPALSAIIIGQSLSVAMSPTTLDPTNAVTFRLCCFQFACTLHVAHCCAASPRAASFNSAIGEHLPCFIHGCLSGCRWRSRIWNAEFHDFLLCCLLVRWFAGHTSVRCILP